VAIGPGHSRGGLGVGAPIGAVWCGDMPRGHCHLPGRSTVIARRDPGDGGTGWSCR
jgi:hypothetical protein